MTGMTPRGERLSNTGPSGRSASRPSSGWFACEPCADGITRIWEPCVAELLQANMFLVQDAGEQLLIDAGLGIVPLRESLAPLLDEPTPLLLTHSHRDHVGAAHEFSERLAHAWESQQLESPIRGALRRAEMAPRYVTLLEQVGYPVPDCLLTEVPDGFDASAYVISAAPATHCLNEGDVVSVGRRRFVVLVVPGHTPGSLALFEEDTGLLLAGDLLYDGPLIDFLPESDPVSYRESLARVLELPLTTICGGHGPPMSAHRAAEVGKGYLTRAPAP
jgi:glyoxylase-like metal-dependent hydrolase (beta-lactamase superfamily II)